MTTPVPSRSEPVVLQGFGSGSPPTIASLFAGMGGFATAFKRRGWRPAWANELDAPAAASYRFRHPESHLVEGDVRGFSPAKLGLAPPDVLTAGFPCQPFSAAGDRRGLDDERGRLYGEIGRIVREYGDDRPAMLLLENVPNLLVHNRGRTFTMVEHEIRDAGYWILPEYVQLLNTCRHTDIPQNRERLFVLALSTRIFGGGGGGVHIRLRSARGGRSARTSICMSAPIRTTISTP